jgi:uncharacterized BrkB/YihY/UPF0761 family membrane protein
MNTLFVIKSLIFIVFTGLSCLSAYAIISRDFKEYQSEPFGKATLRSFGFLITLFGVSLFLFNSIICYVLVSMLFDSLIWSTIVDLLIIISTLISCGYVARVTGKYEGYIKYYLRSVYGIELEP